MVDGLSGRAAVVRDDAIAGVLDPLGMRDLRGDREQSPGEDRVRVRHVGERRDVGARHDQHVRGRDGRDIADREHQVVHMDLRRRDLAGDDPAEEAGVGHRCLDASVRVG